MFTRFRDALAQDKKLKEEAKAEGRAEVYQEITEWNRRRIETAARGEKFTEPLPGPPPPPLQIASTGLLLYRQRFRSACPLPPPPYG